MEPAVFLGMLDSLGTVEVGKLADLVLLEANPLSDIRNAARPTIVVANGRAFSIWRDERAGRVEVRPIH